MWARFRHLWLLLVLPGLGLVLFSATGRDDAFITYWPAYTLSKFSRIVNFDGERIEQSSSLLETVLLGVANRVTGISIPWIGYGVAVGAGAVTALLAFYAARRIDCRAGIVAALLVSTAVSIVYWAFGGLETTLTAALLLACLLASAPSVEATHTWDWRRLAPAAVLTALFVTVRPEAGLVLACTFGGAALVAFVWYRQPVRAARLALLVGVTMAAFAVLGLARLAYFGDWFPHPVGAKVGGLDPGDGLRYLRDSWLRLDVAPLVLLGAGGVYLVLRARQTLGVLIAAGAVAVVGSVTLSGGDWMEAGRLLVPALALLAVLAAVALARLPAGMVVAGFVVAVQVGGVVVYARDDAPGRPLWVDAPSSVADAGPSFGWPERANRRYLRDAQVVEPLIRVVATLRDELGRKPVVASGHSGMVPFYVFQELYGQATWIDMYGLTTDTFAACDGRIEKTAYGTKMSYPFWFEHVDECGIALPDVIYGQGEFASRNQAVTDRFTAVHQQRGETTSGSDVLPGATLTKNQFIAVRNDLVPRLGLPKMRA